MTTTYRVLCLSEAVSPITHMARSAGNESIIAREPVITPRGVAWVPVLSGNALRHRMVREPGVRWLVERYDLAGQLSLPQLNFLFHGGNLTEGGGRENTARIATMQRLFPLLRLLGGCLPDQVLAGSLLASRGMLVCEENAQSLRGLIPSGWDLPAVPLHSAEHFVSGYQYTRGDARKTASALAQPSLADEVVASNLMIFTGQAITRGACFLHEFTLQHVAEVELGALLLSLRLWQGNGGTVGGAAARGHGKLSTMVYCGDADQDEVVEQYIEHVDASRKEAIGWLNDSFGAVEAEKPKRGQAKKGVEGKT